MQVHIRYRSGAGVISERTISAVEVVTPHEISAYCHLRNERRSFLLARIVEATDVSNSKPIADLGTFLGVAPEVTIRVLPKFSGRNTELDQDQLRNLRTSDKAALFRRFKYPVIAHAKKNQLLSLFADRCFRCHTSAGLELDHHVPQKKGGRLVPGNVVVLCGKCNINKRDTLPEEFYSASELEALTPLLTKELQFFEFHFDWSMWYHDPLAYLVTLGVEPEMARCAIYEPNHLMFVPHPINRHLLSTDELDASTMPGLTIGVDTEIPDRE